MASMVVNVIPKLVGRGLENRLDGHGNTENKLGLLSSKDLVIPEG